MRLNVKLRLFKIIDNQKPKKESKPSGGKGFLGIFKKPSSTQTLEKKKTESNADKKEAKSKKENKPTVHFATISNQSPNSSVSKPPPPPPLPLPGPPHLINKLDSIPEKQSEIDHQQGKILKVPDPLSSVKRSDSNSFPPPPHAILYDIPPQKSSTSQQRHLIVPS